MYYMGCWMRWGGRRIKKRNRWAPLKKGALWLRCKSHLCGTLRVIWFWCANTADWQVKKRQSLVLLYYYNTHSRLMLFSVAQLSSQQRSQFLLSSTHCHFVASGSHSLLNHFIVQHLHCKLSVYFLLLINFNQFSKSSKLFTTKWQHVGQCLRWSHFTLHAAFSLVRIVNCQFNVSFVTVEKQGL